MPQPVSNTNQYDVSVYNHGFTILEVTKKTATPSQARPPPPLLIAGRRRPGNPNRISGLDHRACSGRGGLTTIRPALKMDTAGRISPALVSALPPRSMVGQLPLEQPIGVRIPGGQPIGRLGAGTNHKPALGLVPPCALRHRHL
jgi:hypothetical protein